MKKPQEEELVTEVTDGDVQAEENIDEVESKTGGGGQGLKKWKLSQLKVKLRKK